MTMQYSPQTRLFAELQDLKRQVPAHFERSISSALFVESWQRLFAEQRVDRVARTVTTKMLLHILLPGCDSGFYHRAGLKRADVREILEHALAQVGGKRVPNDVVRDLRDALPEITDEYSGAVDPIRGEPAWFVEALCRQPRAGATSPGKPRLLLTPPEMHSDHCLLTATYAYLLSHEYKADPAVAWLCGLAHHLHNAVLPDCGFAGEILLEPWLDRIFQNGRQHCLAAMPPPLAAQVRDALTHHETISAPEGKAISAGDVLDRVLDVRWRTRAAAVRDEDILDELELVHAGALKTFQDHLLDSHGVWKSVL